MAPASMLREREAYPCLRRLFRMIAVALTFGVVGIPAHAERRQPPARPVVLDTDADFDDTAALAALAQAHRDGRIDLRAVTITNNGGGKPGKGYQHVRCLLARLGLPDVPVADATYDLPNAYPPFVRETVDQVIDDAIAPDCAAGQVRPTRTASQLLADVLAASPGQVTLIATGPVTNVARAFDALRQRFGLPPALFVRLVYVQGGNINGPPDHTLVPEPFDGTQSVNTWGDAAAMQRLIDTLLPLQLRLVADATGMVPVNLGYVDRIAGAARTPAAAYAARLMNHPILRGAVTAGQPVFWWDPLAAVSALQGVLDPIVAYRLLRIEVIPSGVQEGRTVVSPAGRPVLVGLAADRQRFEDTFLNTLNGG